MRKTTPLLLALLLWATQAASNDIRVIGHQIPPFSMHENNGSVSGFSADLFRQIHANIHKGHETTIIPATFKRLYAELQMPHRTVGITVGRNQKRDKLFKWVGPYLTVDLGVIGKKNRQIQIFDFEDLKDYVIATVENTAPEQALLKLGFPEDKLMRDLYPKRNIQKLANNRVDFFAYPLQATSYLMNKHDVDTSEYEEIYSLKRIELYFAFSKDFTDREIAEFQSSLDAYLKTDDFKRLRHHYALDGIKRLIPTRKERQ